VSGSPSVVPMELPSDLHPDLVPLVFLLGRWEGVGVGGYPSIEDFQFGQELTVSHDGRPFLSWSSRSWALDETGARVRPLAVETGYWRVHDGGEVELLLAHPTGYAEVWLGQVQGARVELATDVVARTATAKDYTAGHRLYGLVEGDLLWAYDMAAAGHPMQSHLSARLRRVAGPGS